MVVCGLVVCLDDGVWLDGCCLCGDWVGDCVCVVLSLKWLSWCRWVLCDCLWVGGVFRRWSCVWGLVG